MSLGALDLNLLLPLHALLEQRNVSRAAQQVSMSQPATSQALARLRRHFDDELLVRVGREYQLTPLAQVLRPQVTAAVHQVTAALDIRNQFDAASSDRAFTVSAADHIPAVLSAPVRTLLRAEAPKVSIAFTALPPDTSFENHMLQHDVLIGPLGHGLPTQTDALWRDDFVAVLDRHNAAVAGGRLTLEALAALPHVVSVFAENFATPADRLMEELGIRRQVAARVSGFLPLLFMVPGTDLVALAPRKLAQHAVVSAALTVAELPDGHRAAWTEAVHSRPSRRQDPAVRWLRTTLVRAARTLDEQQPALVTA